MDVEVGDKGHAGLYRRREPQGKARFDFQIKALYSLTDQGAPKRTAITPSAAHQSRPGARAGWHGWSVFDLEME
jgi:hypothetical protein